MKATSPPELEAPGAAPAADDDAPDPLGALARAAAEGQRRGARCGCCRSLAAPVTAAIRDVLLGPRHPELDDAVQEALLAISAALERFRGESTFLHYARRIAVRTALALRRSRDDRARPGWPRRAPRNGARPILGSGSCCRSSASSASRRFARCSTSCRRVRPSASRTGCCSNTRCRRSRARSACPSTRCAAAYGSRATTCVIASWPIPPCSRCCDAEGPDLMLDDIPPEELLVTTRVLSDLEEQADLRAHLARCPGCAMQATLRGDVAPALVPTDVDYEIGARAVAQVLASQRWATPSARVLRGRAPARPRLATRAAVMLLVVLGSGVAAAALVLGTRGRLWGTPAPATVAPATAARRPPPRDRPRPAVHSLRASEGAPPSLFPRTRAAAAGVAAGADGDARGARAPRDAPATHAHARRRAPRRQARHQRSSGWPRRGHRRIRLPIHLPIHRPSSSINSSSNSSFQFIVQVVVQVVLATTPSRARSGRRRRDAASGGDETKRRPPRARRGPLQGRRAPRADARSDPARGRARLFGRLAAEFPGVREEVIARVLRGRAAPRRRPGPPPRGPGVLPALRCATGRAALAEGATPATRRRFRLLGRAAEEAAALA